MTMLDKVIGEYNPKYLSSGQIRMMCPLKEHHYNEHGVRVNGFESMYVTPDSNMCHCFSCGYGGTLTRLLTTRLGVPFVEAIEMVQLDSFEELPSYEETEEDSRECSTYVPKNALDFSVQPDMFLKRGYSKKFLRDLKVGRYIADDGNEVATIPLFQDGRLVDVLHRKDGAIRRFWYENNFNRRSYLYGEPLGDVITLVEGPTSRWRPLMYGDLTVSATLGAILSEGQVSRIRLKKYKEVRLAYDNDMSGMRQTEAAYLMLSPYVDVTFIPYPSEDPDKCPEDDWFEAVENRSDYVEYSMEMMTRIPDYGYIQMETLRKFR